MNEITKEQLQEKLDEKYTQEQLAAYFGCGITTIKRRKKELGLVGYKTNKKPLNNNELQKVESLANSGYNLKEASKELGRAPETLKLYIPENLHKALVANSIQQLRSRMQKSTFSKLLEPTKDTAYMLGYLVADGSITPQGSISAYSIDMELIQHFTKFFSSSLNNSGVTSANNIIYSSTSKDFKLLEKVKKATNLVPNKTYVNYEIPDWILNSAEFINYFIVGIFNGDGWCYKIKDRDTVEIGIMMHKNQSDMLLNLNKYLLWNHYLSSAKDTATLSSKKINTVQNFARMYCRNEYALSRKAEILLRYSLTQ